MIFNKSDNGSDELKELIGFIDASVTFDNIKTYIDFAERDLKKIIGPEIFKVALDHYLSENYLQEDDDEGSGSGSGTEPTNSMLDMLVNYIQLPIAFHADLTYEQSNDLSHTDKGRRMRVSEEEKLPFEWLIRQDNDNILSLAHKSTDILLEFLMENKQYFPEWTGSDAYKKSLSLFINTAEQFDEIFPIDCSRRLFLILSTIIKQAEKKYILPVIGKEKFTDLKSKIITGDPGNDEDLLEMIKVPLALYTMAIAVRRLPVQVLPSGIMQNYDNIKNTLYERNPADKDVSMRFAISLEADAKNELKNLQDFVSAGDDPEYIPSGVPDRHDPHNNFFRA